MIINKNVGRLSPRNEDYTAAFARYRLGRDLKN